MRRFWISSGAVCPSTPGFDACVATCANGSVGQCCRGWPLCDISFLLELTGPLPSSPLPSRGFLEDLPKGTCFRVASLALRTCDSGSKPPRLLGCYLVVLMVLLLLCLVNDFQVPQ